MALLSSVTVTASGTCSCAAFPDFIFRNYALFREKAEECSAYHRAVAEYANAIKPAAVAKAVRAARACGYTFIDADSVRESAVFGLRESLMAIGGFDESDVEWHVANPGKCMPVGFF